MNADMPRYLSGLVLAFLLIGVALTATIVSSTLMAGREPRIHAILDVWLFFGLITVAALALVVGPVILLLRRWWGPAFTVAWAAAAGAALGLLLPLPVWLLTRESYETFGNLVQFWLRLPMEFVLGALPGMTAAALFAGWIIAGKAPAHRYLTRH